MNAMVADLVADANAARPITAGGTGETTARLKDGTWRFQNTADTTKLLAFNLSPVPTATTVTVTAPAASGTMALLSAGPSAEFTGALYAPDLVVRYSAATTGFMGRTGSYKGNAENNLGFFAETGKGIEFATNGAVAPKMALQADGDLIWGDDPLAGSGNLGVSVGLAEGTAGPFFVVSTSITASSVACRFRNGNGTVGQISTTGSTTTYGTSSDYRLKDDVADLTGSGDFIDSLRPVHYKWKVDGSAAAGFIAHEVQQVSPSSVQGEKDGEEMQSMMAGSSEIIANMVAELQSLRARVSALEGQ